MNGLVKAKDIGEKKDEKLVKVAKINFRKKS